MVTVPCMNRKGFHNQPKNDEHQTEITYPKNSTIPTKSHNKVNFCVQAQNFLFCKAILQIYKESNPVHYQDINEELKGESEM